MHFSPHRRVVSVDLRGHGQSDAPEQDYTVGAFADDLAWLAAELVLEQPVVIGHSLGGVIALDLAARYPTLPRAVVALDAPIVPPPALKEYIRPFVAQLRTDGYMEPLQKFISGMFLPTDDADRKQRIVERMMSAPRHVLASAMEKLVDYDSDQAAAACKVPLLTIGSAVPACDVARLRKLCPRAVTGQTVGAGHFHQLEVPEQVNAMIDRFLSMLV